MNIIMVNESNVELFLEVLKEAASWLISIEKPMWNPESLTVQKLLQSYKLDELRLCYDNNNLIGAFVLQWYDPLFWSELKEFESGYLHKLAIRNEYRGKGYGKELIASAEHICKACGIKWLRLNCGTFRPNLRKFYESVGFRMLDRVFIDNRDQVRYVKELI